MFLDDPLAPARALRHASAIVVDLVLPPRCVGCRTLVQAGGALCPTCWQGIRFIEPPVCRCCGRPLGSSAAQDALCPVCAELPPAFDHARAGVVYDDHARSLILAYKHGERLECARAFVPWMLRAGDELLAEASLIVPVPLHFWRLAKRGFNQSSLLARELSRLTGVPWLPDGFDKTRSTASQQTLTARQRQTNVTANVFALTTQARQAMADAHVVLIDDVYTTGATANACARVLRKAGAARIDVLTIARVVRDELV